MVPDVYAVYKAQYSGPPLKTSCWWPGRCTENIATGFHLPCNWYSDIPHSSSRNNISSNGMCYFIIMLDPVFYWYCQTCAIIFVQEFQAGGNNSCVHFNTGVLMDMGCKELRIYHGHLPISYVPFPIRFCPFSQIWYRRCSLMFGLVTFLQDSLEPPQRSFHPSFTLLLS